MKNILYFILGIFLVVGISATTVEVMTVKPAIPKYTKVIYGEEYYQINKSVNQHLNSGYIISSQSQGSGGRIIIVMVKY